MPFIVMELVEGRPLSEVVREESLSLGTALEYGIAIADALEHAHQHRIVHRDLKSSNVMVDRDGKPVVLDFGLARRLPMVGLERSESMVTAAGALAGTLSHMAPEVLLGGQADTRSDVWSLGVLLLFELTTGELPFKG
jgi:eukaryotic-like serine/threonine-protein kinase